MTHQELLAAMRAAAFRFQKRHDSFAAGKEQILFDMIGRVERTGGFASEKQRDFALKLIAWSQPREQAPAAAPIAVAEGAVSRVRRLFDTAKANGLKFPKIRLQAADGEKLVIGEAGPNSRYRGALMLTDGQPFGSNKFFGRIEGTSLMPAPAMSPSVQALIEALGDNPERVAEAYGRLTGNCCFCSRALSDGRSVAMGYGPVCAEKFGLEWGEQRAKAKISLEEPVAA